MAAVSAARRRELTKRVEDLVDEAAEWVACPGWSPVRVRLFEAHAMLVAINLNLRVDVVVESALAAARQRSAA